MSIKPIRIAACKGVGPFSAASLPPPHPFSFLSARCLSLPTPHSFPRIQSNVARLPDKSRSKKRRNALTGSKRLSVFLRHFRCDSFSLSLFRSSPVPLYRIGNSTFDILPIYDLSYQSLIDLYKVKIKLETVETDFRHLGKGEEGKFCGIITRLLL